MFPEADLCNEEEEEEERVIYAKLSAILVIKRDT